MPADDAALSTLFARLDLAPTASVEEVHNAYKLKVRQCAAEGKSVAEVKEAHQILSDSMLRDAYRLPGAAKPLSIGVVEFGKGPNDESGQEPVGETGRPAYGFAGFQGHRASMEDAMLKGAPCGASSHIFGVCDGHGDRRAADYLLETLPEVVAQLPLAESMTLHLPNAAQKAYAELDRTLLETQAAEGWHDGSTALLAVVSKRRLQLLQARAYVDHRPRRVPSHRHHGHPTWRVQAAVTLPSHRHQAASARLPPSPSAHRRPSLAAPI